MMKLKNSQPFIEFTFIWLHHLNSIAENIYFFNLKNSFLPPVPLPTPPSPSWSSYVPAGRDLFTPLCKTGLSPSVFGRKSSLLDNFL
jgi:hypothetical protein